ncbi:MAG: XdhC family protein [Ilumatobacteraceae bacterium]|nr:XdhC family protein [Ilumatobacteraceae bacterium]
MAGDPTIEGLGVLERAVDMARRGEEFVLATVVWREGPTSGQSGARAILTAGGDVHGWIGGACAEPVFIREATKALTDGTPRLIALGDPDRFGDLPPGTVPVEMSCQSEGALQIYIEPVLAVPHLVVVGSSPMADLLQRLGAELGWNAELVAGDDFTSGQIGAHSFTVIATQGHNDEDIIERAAKARPAYLGVVASAKRGAALREFLADRDVPSDVLDALRCPAGIDLGHTTHNEIAIAILAELVQLRAAGAAAGARETPIERVEAIDPVCAMTVTIDPSAQSYDLDGIAYYFCCAGCRTAFANDPASYLTEASS